MNKMEMWKKNLTKVLFAVCIFGVDGNPCSSITDSIYHERPGNLDDFCYWVITTPQNADDSQTKCQENDGILATIPDKDSDKVVQDLMKSKGFTSCYIGVQDKIENGIYMTYNNQFQWYFNWKPGDPDENPNFQCVIATEIVDSETFEFLEYRWSDVDCSANKKALCSKAIQPAIDHSSTYQRQTDTHRGKEFRRLFSKSLTQCAALCKQSVFTCVSFRFKEPECILLNNDATIPTTRSEYAYFRLVT